MSFLTGWTYRITVAASRASGTVTNYPMKLKVYFGAGTNGTEVVEGVTAAKLYCHSACKTDFSDIRFTTSDEATLLDCHLEQKVDSSYAIFWVELNSIGTGATTFYVYYGNSSASAVSNGANTYSVFDDFERGSDGDTVGGDWTEVTAHCHISTDQDIGNVTGFQGTRSLKLVGSVAANPTCTIPIIASANIAIQFRIYKEDAASLDIYHGDGTTLAAFEYQTDEDICVYDGATWVDTTYNITVDTWELVELNNFDWSAKTCDVWHQGVKIKSGADISFSSALYTNLLGFFGDIHDGYDIWIDNFIVRNYRATEPTWGSWGTEEINPAGGTLVIQPCGIDTYISEAAPGTNYGSNGYLQCCSLATTSRKRIIVQFDFSVLPAGATITAAILALYYYTYFLVDPVGRSQRAYELTQTAWTEDGATWNKYNGSDNWASAGGDYELTDGASLNIPAGYGWMEWNVLALAQHFQASHSEVANFLVKDALENQSTNNFWRFYSSEATTDIALLPKLVITYTGSVSYDINGDVSLSLSPGATLLEGLLVQGALSSSFTVGSTINTSYIVAGSLACTLVPSITSLCNYIIVGSSIVSILTGYTLDESIGYIGDLPISLTTSYSIDNSLIIQGNLPLTAVTSYDLSFDFILDVDLPISLSPGSSIVTSFLHSGDIDLLITPSLSCFTEYILNGNITTSLLPFSTILENITVSGDVLLGLFPESTVIGVYGYTVSGDISLSLLPTHTLDLDYIISGTISCSLIVNSTIEAYSSFIYSGNIIAELILSSEHEISQNLGFYFTVEQDVFCFKPVHGSDFNYKWESDKKL